MLMKGVFTSNEVTFFPSYGTDIKIEPLNNN